MNISEPIVAACPEPIPGRKEQRGAEIEAAITDLINCFFGSFIFFRGEIFCFANAEEVFFRLTIKADEPNRPVKSGSRGSLTGRLNVIMPRRPAREKIINEFKKFSSWKIR